MNSYFSSHFFEANRQKLRRVFKGTAPIIIAANGLLQRGGDSTYAFSQDANFWYLSGLDEPDLLLIMDQSEEYLIVPSRSGVRQTFDGSVSFSELAKRSGITTIYESKEGWEKLEKRLSKVKHIATVAAPPAYVEQLGFYTNPTRNNLAIQVRARKQGLELLDVGQDLARLRMIKQAPELKAIQQAIDITIDSLKSATKLSKLSKYGFEYELEAEIRAGFRRQGATGDAFEPIVAAGKNACTLHNVANNDQITKDSLVLTDVGAEVEHYAADITRVFTYGKSTSRQRDVHAAVIEVQQYALGILKAGVIVKEYEQRIEHYMGQKLRELGLIKEISHENVRRFYPHSTSHFLGLNVHDVGDYSLPLEPGVILTVEPGIYIPDEGIGIRIEDDVLITRQGNKVLSDRLSRMLA